MERAVHLSESMDSRGFARLQPTAADHVAAWSGMGALLALGGGFVALIGQQDLVAAALACAGTALLVAAVVGTSRSVRRSRYRARRFRPADWLVMTAAVLTPVVVAGFSLADEGSLRWSAYPLQLPDVNAFVVLALLGLAVPLALPPQSQKSEP